MNSVPPPDDPILTDVLGEAAPDEFRSAVLAETLRHARSRRRLRRARAAGALIALPLLLVALLQGPRRPAPPLPPSSPGALPAAPSFCQVVRTRPGPGLALATRPLADGDRLASVAFAASDRVRTDLRHAPLLIDDAELLALAAPRPAALVRLGPGVQQLVFGDKSTGP